MKILQVLPALNSGGVERGTVEFSAELVRRGHQSIVLSSGGPMVAALKQHGAEHVTLPVHRKSLASVGQIRPVRALLRSLQPDIVHVRSRMPAWIVHFALRGLSDEERPALVSTFHGLYSVNRYSAIMARARHVIAISECVRDYVLSHYPVPPDRLTVIQRGVDVSAFRQRTPDSQWTDALLTQYPQLRGKQIILMPGRISRWKGQHQFLHAMAEIRKHNPACHGLIVGGAEGRKVRFLQELEKTRAELGLEDAVTFLGQRSDIGNLYLFADVVCHMSTRPEPFGRTMTEALASGTPVVAFDRGGAAEILHACFPEGLVPPDDSSAFARKVLDLLTQSDFHIELPERFHLQAQVESTITVYRRVLAAGRGSPTQAQ